MTRTTSGLWAFLTESEVMNEPWTLWVPFIGTLVVIAWIRANRHRRR